MNNQIKNKTNNEIEISTHSQILKSDISTQTSNLQQAFILLMLHDCNEENSNQQHTDNDSR